MIFVVFEEVEKQMSKDFSADKASMLLARAVVGIYLIVAASLSGWGAYYMLDQYEGRLQFAGTL